MVFTTTETKRTLVARRGSNEVETAQVAGASDEHGKDRDEEAGTQNPV
jgi:solute carrier family 35 protein F1/2